MGRQGDKGTREQGICSPCLPLSLSPRLPLPRSSPIHSLRSRSVSPRGCGLLSSFRFALTTPPLGTHRFQRAGVGGRLIGGPKRAWSRMRATVGDNNSMQARRHRERLIPINTSFAEPARWKRCAPRRGFPFVSRHCQQCRERLIRLSEGNAIFCGRTDFSLALS
jgi:hypothetical protein